jgi:hypothetical protein
LLLSPWGRDKKFFQRILQIADPFSILNNLRA